MPLRAPFRSATGVEHERDIVLVRVASTDGVEGWGECGALATPHYTDEYVDGATDVIERFLAPTLLAHPDLRGASVGAALAWCKGHPMAKAALEMAVLDAELQGTGQPLAAYLGGTRTRVAAGVAVGLHDDLDVLIATVLAHAAEGYRRIKLKIAPGRDVEVVRAVRTAVGPDLVLQVDANGAYGPADIEHLAQLDAADLDLALIEQPFAADDLPASAALAARLRTPICLDESITSAATAARALDLGAASAICIKAAHVGGLLEARRAHDVCATRGTPAWVGGMLDTGIGRAANVALASLPGFTLPGDLAASERYWDVDLTQPFVLDDGHLAVPTTPGLGRAPLPHVLDAVTTGSRWLRS